MKIKRKFIPLIIFISLIPACNLFDNKNISITTSNKQLEKNLQNSSKQNNNKIETIGSTADIKELATIHGKIYNEKGEVVDYVLVKAKSLENNVPWTSQSQETIEGFYIFRNVPVGINVEISISKNGVIKNYIVFVKSNLTGNPNENTFDFGHSLDNKNSDNNNFLKVDAKSLNVDPRPIDLPIATFSPIPSGSTIWDGTYPPTNSSAPNPIKTCPFTPTPTPTVTLNLIVPIQTPCP